MSIFISGFTYQLALPGHKLSFPADHYSHPDFKTEWWYYTGHLETESGKRYGYQVTFFRFGVRDRQNGVERAAIYRLYMRILHSPISAQRDFISVNGSIVDTATGPAPQPIAISFGTKTGELKEMREDHTIQVNDRGTRLRLVLKSVKAPVLHGRDGLSQKGDGEGRASYYYSLTRMDSDRRTYHQRQKGKNSWIDWMDHEFGSNQLREDQVGWDWFSVQLDNDTELTLYPHPA